jgi:WD40 repeat protein
MDVAFSPDSTLVAAASVDQSASRNRTCARAPATSAGGPPPTRCTAWRSRPTARLLTACADGLIRVHGVDATARRTVALPGHEAYVFRLAFDPSGDTLASASGDDTARLWSTIPAARRIPRAR